MIACFDLDGTLGADPDFYRAEMAGLRANDVQVHVLSGSHTSTVTTQEIAQKLAKLARLGFVKGRDYDEAYAVAGPEKNVPQNKVAYMRHVGATHLIDNSKANVKAARKAGFTGHHHMSPKKEG